MKSWPIGKVHSNFHSLEDVRKNQEIDHKTSVWIFKRMLSLLGWVHHLGIIHGSVLPCHVLVYPDNDGEAHSDPKQHTVRLIDWCYSVNKSRTKLSAWLPEYESFYAPEVLDKKVSPSVDLYMTARMIKSLTVADFPEPLEKVLSRCLDKDPTKRYLNSSEVFDAWERAAFESYGAPKWHDFIMKGI